MKYIFALVQVLSLIWLVALAFPQRGQSGGIGNDFIIFDNDDDSSSIAPSSFNTTPSNIVPSSTTQRTTDNCPCVTTSEYNPVCGTNNVTYWNMGSFNCAKSCNPHLC